MHYIEILILYEINIVENFPFKSLKIFNIFAKYNNFKAVIKIFMAKLIMDFFLNYY